MSDVRQFPAEVEDNDVAAMFISWDFANRATTSDSYTDNASHLDALLNAYETAFIRLAVLHDIDAEDEDEEEDDDEVEETEEEEEAQETEGEPVEA